MGIKARLKGSHVLCLYPITTSPRLLPAFGWLETLHDQTDDLLDCSGSGRICLSQVVIELFGGGVHERNLANPGPNGKR